MNAENKIAIASLAPLVSVFVIVMILSISFSDKPITIEDVISSNVLITDGTGHGSGVYLGDGIILTAWHCLGIEGAWIEDSEGNQYEILDEIYCGDYTEDIGFIRMNPKADKFIKPMTRFAKRTPDVGEVAYICGTPLDTFLFGSFTKGIITNVKIDFPGWWDDATIADTRACPGNSGGGVYNKDFELIGILVGGYTGYDNIAICEPIEDILRMMGLEL